MSYILEALKKSDKERRRERVPDLQTDHSPAPSRRLERRSPTNRLFIIVLLLLAVFAVLYWFLPQLSEEASPDSPSTDMSVVPEPAVAAVAEEEKISPEMQKQIAKEVRQAITEVSLAESAEVEMGSPQPQTENRKPHTANRAPQPAPPIASEDYPLLADLDSSVRERVPELVFAGHVYSDAADERMIIINNRIVREGDMVGDQLALWKITRDGVVLQVEATFFKVNLF